MLKVSFGLILGIVIQRGSVLTCALLTKATVCTWDSKTGSTYDLRPMMLKDTAYTLSSSSLPCASEDGSTISYTWNICAPIPKNAIPTVCSNTQKYGYALLWADNSPVYKECLVIGTYDESHDNNNNFMYKLIDSKDPTLGVSVTYPPGDRCEDTNTYRSVSIDIFCANTPFQMISAQLTSQCDYNIRVKSYYGCPVECPVTKAGLCNSHGYCKYDKLIKQSYCYCNHGYTGNSCSDKASSNNSNNNGNRGMLRIQIGLLVTLLFIALGLLMVVGYMGHRIILYRKEQQAQESSSSSSTQYAPLSGGDTELTETIVVRF